MTRESLIQAFSQHGRVLHAFIPKNGFGFVTFESSRDACTAKDAMQHRFIDGRPAFFLRCSHAVIFVSYRLSRTGNFASSSHLSAHQAAVVALAGFAVIVSLTLANPFSSNPRGTRTVTPPSQQLQRHRRRACTYNAFCARVCVSNCVFQVTAVSMTAATITRLFPPTPTIAEHHLLAGTTAADSTAAAATMVLQGIMIEAVGMVIEAATITGMGGKNWVAESSDGSHAELSSSCTLVLLFPFQRARQALPHHSS
jgi:hypothetical protein